MAISTLTLPPSKLLIVGVLSLLSVSFSHSSFNFSSLCTYIRAQIKISIDTVDTGEPAVSSSAWVGRPSTHTSAVRVGPSHLKVALAGFNIEASQ